MPVKQPASAKNARRGEIGENDPETVDSADDWSDDAVAEMAPIQLHLSAADGGVRLDKVLSQHIPQFSRGRIQHWIENGRVTLDGTVAHMKSTVFGDEAVLVLPQAAPEEIAFQPEPMPLAIIAEDDAILVLDKPAGLVVHPAAGNWSGTLLNGLLHHCPALSGVPRAGIVHRLDKDTSGLMVVAKTLEAHTDLVRQLQARSVQREYLALVWGTPHAGGTVEGAIGRHPRDRIKMAVLETERAKPARTHYQRLATGQLDGRAVSLVRCQLETGRTHQIRVHMHSLGWPLVGDALYGKTHLASVFPRQALQAWRLGLMHPVTHAQCAWRVPLAPDFATLLTRAGIDWQQLLESAAE